MGNYSGKKIAAFLTTDFTNCTDLLAARGELAVGRGQVDREPLIKCHAFGKAILVGPGSLVLP